MGFVSGQEFIVAIDEARKVGADILLGDRDVKVNHTTHTHPHTQ
jgi:pheromone shutdown protein TraB